MGVGMAWAWARSRCLAKVGVTVGGHMSATLGAQVAEHLLAPLAPSGRCQGGRGRGAHGVCTM